MAKNSSARGDLESFIETLNLPTKPAIHVNGKDHQSAVVVVDFGAPTDPVRLNSEQSQELAAKLRKFARELVNRDATIRVSSDNYMGIVFYASVA